MSAPRHRRQAVREVAAWLRGLNPESREHAASDPGAVEVALAEKLVDEAEQNPGLAKRLASGRVSRAVFV